MTLPDQIAMSALPIACAGVTLVPVTEPYGLPPDAVVGCCRAAHGPFGHEGFLATPGQVVHLRWDTLESTGA